MCIHYLNIMKRIYEIGEVFKQFVHDILTDCHYECEVLAYFVNRTDKRGGKLNYSNRRQASDYSFFCNFSIFQIFIFILCATSVEMVKASSFHSNFKYGNNTVKTKYGLLRGIVVRSDPLVEAYLGIPYASPPIGSLRFMPPITPSSWKSIRNADRFSPVCPQTVPMPSNGPEALLEVPRARLIQLRKLLPILSNQSEDCLYLNMYVPKTPSRNNNDNSYISPELAPTKKAPLLSNHLSTLVFIQGESYEWNSGNPYDGSELAAQGNMIIVTINFRLGILGFLKTGGKESAQGNFGLMDLVAGLHWLKENLPAFGGDSNKITIMGHGTGAALANILLVSPVSSDLLERGVLISGSALSPWAIQKSPLYVKKRVAEQTGCHGDLLYDDIAPCLRTKNLSDLLAVKINHARFLSGFAPFVDGTVIPISTGNANILNLPLGSAIISSAGVEFANFPKQNLLFGLTSIESYLDLSAQDLEYGLNETNKDRILRTFVRNIFNYHLTEIFAVLKNEYTDWERATRNPFSSRDATLAFLSDGHTASHLIKVGHMHSLRGGKSYFLHFRHKTVEAEYPMRSGSVHGEDIPFWFGLPISPIFSKNYSTEEKKLSLVMVQYLSNFVKSGDPNQSLVYLNKNSENENNFIGEPERNVSEINLEQNSSTPIMKVYGTRHSSLSLYLRASLVKHKESLRKKRNMDKEMLEHNKIHKRNTALDNVIYEFSNRSRKTYIINELPHWEAYDSINQLYLELGHNAEVHSHYRGHKLSMWLNLIPQLHTNSEMNDASLAHHQFAEEDVQFYDGIVRRHLEIKAIDSEQEISAYTEKSNANNDYQYYSKNTDQTDVTADCVLNVTQYPLLNTTKTYNNSSNTSESVFNVLENMDVVRRLNGKQLQSYTTAFIATIAVGCFLLTLNVLIFAAIYHQRKTREKYTRNIKHMNQPKLKNPLDSTRIDTPIKELPDEINYFESGTNQKIDKDNFVDVIAKESTWIYSTNKVDLLDVPHLSVDTNEHKDAFTKPVIKNKDMSPENELISQTSAIAYQHINGYFDNRQTENIPKPPPPPKSISQGGILRVTGINLISSTNKKRVHIQEISV